MTKRRAIGDLRSVLGLLAAVVVLAVGTAGLAQVEIVALDVDRPHWETVRAAAAQAGLSGTAKFYNEAALYNQVYFQAWIGLARFDIAEFLVGWVPSVAGRFLDLSPYARELAAAGLELYSYRGSVIGVVLPWREGALAGIFSRSARVQDAVRILTYLPAGGAVAPEAKARGIPLTIGPVTITKTEKSNPHVDGALETFVAAARQVVSTGVLTALSHLPAQAQDALTRVAGMLGIPLSPGTGEVTLVIESKGGVAPLGVAVERVSSPLGLTKVSVPLAQLESFLSQVGPGVYVRLPYVPHELAVTSEGAALVGTSAFHSLGNRGAGVKIAVIDLGFGGLSTAQAQGDLPYSVITRDFTGTGIATGISHGTAVAQIVYDVAPEAELYLIKIANEVDLDNAVSYCISEGVHVINHSLGWFNTNFYDGTGTIAAIARRATAAGILWVQGAGNFGLKHYGATFTDGNGDGWHDTDVTFTATAGQQIILYLTWDAWPATADDYDLYLYGPSGALVASSTATQGGTEQPTERIITTAAASGTYRLRIQRAAGSARRLSVFSIVQDLTPAVPASSMPAPANASEVLSVGAINWSNYTTGPIAAYSSRGPTGDGRQKPDLAAPDNVTTGVAYYNPFPGTSAAAPHVAGVAGLLKAENPGLSAADLRTRLLSFCVPMGDPYSFGAGRLEARPQPVAQPDLVIANITWSPTNPTVGSTVNFTVTVRNQGTTSAGSFVVRLQGVGPSQDRTVSSLGAGSQTNLMFSLPLSTSPETFTATADVFNQVSESDETNNTATRTVTGVTPALGFTVATDKSVYTVGEPVRITVQLSRPSYVYLVELDAAGRAVLVFPNWRDPNNQVPAGTTQFPRSTTYAYVTSEPVGSEQIVGFASDRAIPLFPTSYPAGYPILSTNGALFLSQVRSWLSGNVPTGSCAEASASFTIQPAANVPPTASFTFSPSSPLVNQWITFDARASTDPDGTIVGYSWDFGDGATGTGSQIQKRYSAAGTYTVTLTVTDNRGATDTTARTVTVGTPNQPPTASFTFTPTNPDPGQNVVFNAAASSDPDGTIVSYAWSFGDGTTGTGMNITKAYAAAGTYTVTLTVTDNLGATGTTTRTIQVGPPPATLPGMPVIDRPGIYVWGTDRWHITVAGDASWPSPRKFQVLLESQGAFTNRVVTGPAPAPTVTTSGGLTRLTWEGTVGAGWVDLAFDLTGATLMKLWLYLDTDGDGVVKPPPAIAKTIVFLRTCKTNPPGNPFAIFAERGATALLPHMNFRVSVVYEDGSVSPVSWSIEYREEKAGCR